MKTILAALLLAALLLTAGPALTQDDYAISTDPLYSPPPPIYYPTPPEPAPPLVIVTPQEMVVCFATLSGVVVCN